MKQLVMDYDKEKHIKRTWVWECDTCPHKIINEELPEEWEENSSLILCEECK